MGFAYLCLKRLSYDTKLHPMIHVGRCIILLYDERHSWARQPCSSWFMFTYPGPFNGESSSNHHRSGVYKANAYLIFYTVNPFRRLAILRSFSAYHRRPRQSESLHRDDQCFVSFLLAECAFIIIFIEGFDIKAFSTGFVMLCFVEGFWHHRAQRYIYHHHHHSLVCATRMRHIRRRPNTSSRAKNLR